MVFRRSFKKYFIKIKKAVDTSRLIIGLLIQEVVSKTEKYRYIPKHQTNKLALSNTFE